MSFKVMGNRVLVDLDEVSQTDGGLYIPQTAAEGPKWGKVVDPGTDYPSGGIMVRSRFTTGERVMIDPLGATKVKYKGREFAIVRNEDVIGVEVE